MLHELLEVCLVSCSCMQKFTDEPELQGVRENVSFFFFLLSFLSRTECQEKFLL